eukprot:m.123492 g.123492  ORF g.123492 m.123492 type:complete len:848 (+) comp9329_c0_seq1:233-2776(+)
MARASAGPILPFVPDSTDHMAYTCWVAQVDGLDPADKNQLVTALALEQDFRVRNCQGLGQLLADRGHLVRDTCDISPVLRRLAALWPDSPIVNSGIALIAKLEQRGAQPKVPRAQIPGTRSPDAGATAFLSPPDSLLPPRTASTAEACAPVTPSNAGPRRCLPFSFTPQSYSREAPSSARQPSPLALELESPIQHQARAPRERVHAAQGSPAAERDVDDFRRHVYSRYLEPGIASVFPPPCPGPEDCSIYFLAAPLAPDMGPHQGAFVGPIWGSGRTFAMLRGQIQTVPDVSARLYAPSFAVIAASSPAASASARHGGAGPSRKRRQDEDHTRASPNSSRLYESATHYPGRGAAQDSCQASAQSGSWLDQPLRVLLQACRAYTSLEEIGSAVQFDAYNVIDLPPSADDLQQISSARALFVIFSLAAPFKDLHFINLWLRSLDPLAAPRAIAFIGLHGDNIDASASKAFSDLLFQQLGSGRNVVHYQYQDRDQYHDLMFCPMNISSPASLSFPIVQFVRDALQNLTGHFDMLANMLAKMLARQFDHVPAGDFLNRKGIPEHVHAQLADWMLEVCEHFLCDHVVFSTAISLLGRYIAASRVVPRADLVLIGFTCVCIACKHSGGTLPTDRLAQYLDGAVTEADIKAKEVQILAALDWRLDLPNARDFLDHFILRLPFHSTDEERDLMARYSMVLIDLTYTYPDYVQYSPALIAASALFCAIVGIEPTATSSGVSAMYTGIPPEMIASHLELRKLFPGLEGQLVHCSTHIRDSVRACPAPTVQQPAKPRRSMRLPSKPQPSKGLPSKGPRPYKRLSSQPRPSQPLPPKRLPSKRLQSQQPKHRRQSALRM